MKPIKRNHLLIPSRCEDIFERCALHRYQMGNRKRLRNKDFTVLANSCVGAQIYRDLDLRFDTPLVGLYITPEDFIKLLSNPKYWFYQPIIEEPLNLGFPVGILGGEIRIFFRSDKTFKEALEKWNRRLERIHWDNLFIFLNPLEQDFGIDPNYKTHICSREVVEDFFNLPYKNKVMVTNKKKLVINDNCVFMPKYRFFEYPPYIGIISCITGRRIFDRYFDVANWLNTGIVKKRPFYNHF